MTRDENTQWVHEEDYGEPAFGTVIVGAVQVVVGLVSFVLGMVAAPKGRHHE